MRGGAVLVTGAGRGIGRSVARALARDGFDLVLWARTTADLVEAAEECGRLGVRVRTASIDVSDGVAVAGELTASLKGIAGLRGVVLNAGTGEWYPFDETPLQAWRAMLETNLGGAFHTLQVALPLLRAVPFSQVVVLGSDAGERGIPGRAAYCSSKWGLRGLTEVLRSEERAAGLRVTQLLVSRVDTTFRGRHAGDRPGALHPDQVAAVVAAVFAQDPDVEIREMRLSSIHVAYGE